jgi:hypothetical protein
MQVMGVRILPVVVAALAIYAVGFVIYGVLVAPETWMEMARISTEEMEAVGTSRMPLSPIMPLMIAFGIGLAIHWRGAAGTVAGIATGFWLALFLLVAGRMYNYVYGVEGLDNFALDAAHLLLNGVVGGAVLGAWPAAKAESNA